MGPNDRNIRRLRRAAAAVTISLAVAIGGPAVGQAPSPPASTNPVLAAAQAAFERLPEAERKAIQNDLIWTGDFTGAVSGSYGPLTFRGINALKARQSKPQDGILAPADRKALADAASQALAALRFETLTDARTGARIGLPLGLLTKSEAVPNGGTRWQSADGKITVDSRIGLPTDTLPALFEKVSAATPTRKVTYKLLRPDFYVVSGETAGGKFYSRMSAPASPAPAAATLRGFSIGYDKTVADSFDKLVIAIAASYDPFPTAQPATKPTAAPLVAATNPPAPTSHGVQSQPVPAPQKPPERLATGLIVAKDRVLVSSAALDGCKTPVRIDGKAARLRGKDDAAGLALLDVEGVDARGLESVAAPIEAGEALLVVAIGETAPGRRGPVVLPATATGPGAILAPLQPGGGGAAVFDGKGRLRGLLTSSPPERYLVAGIALPRGHAVADAARISALLGTAGIRLAPSESTTTLSTGAVAERAALAVVGLSCGL